MDLNVPIVNKRMVFLLYSSINILLRVLSFSFRSSPRATCLKWLLHYVLFGLSAVAITRLDIASGVSPSEIILLPTSSKYREGSNSLFVGLI